MARKKTATAGREEGPVATEEAAEALPVAVEQPQEATQAGSVQGATGDKRKPLVSYRTSSDRGTQLEVAVWSNTYRTQQGEEYEQLSVTIQRSYKDANGTWCKGGSYRAHDVPCLLFLLNKAYAFCLERRTSDSNAPF